MTAPSGEQFELTLGGQHAVVVEVGGGLRTYSVDGSHVLDGYGADEPCSSGRGQVLIPWPNRLEDGSYEFDGERHQLDLNEPERGNAIHGLVRSERWAAREREPHRVVLEHEVAAPRGYPFRLAVSIDYSLAPDGLTVRTTATNVGEAACPYGAGAHPYLRVGAEPVDALILHVPASTVLHPDERGLPLPGEHVGGTEYDFRRPRQVGSTKLDHTFTELARDEDGIARVALSRLRPGSGVELWVDRSYAYLQLFTGDPLPDVDRRSLAVEPMTCPANAFRTGEGLIRLEPGASVTSTWGIQPLAMGL